MGQRTLGLSATSAIVESTTSHPDAILSATEAETDELLEREGRIERAQRNAYLEIGLDLKAIRDPRPGQRPLYKVPRDVPVAGRYSFTTFEEYVEERWGWDASRARQLIGAAEATEEIRKRVTTVTLLPTSERHVRELLKIDSDDDRAAVWQSVIDRDETITAKVVAEQVARFIAQKEKNWLTVAEWEALPLEEREGRFDLPSHDKFNQQDGPGIEWAQWSWNPITGCKHDCPYCYARDIANRFYAQGFEPSIYPARFAAPTNTKVPSKADEDVAYRNVFTGSMADIFGRWVPVEWIDEVMCRARDNPQWNFLFLTKFPQRFAEVDAMPDNAWLGTTVDCQSRVANAEKAFAKIKGGTKWISIEPMLTRLKFKRLDLFQWVVIGGASKSTATPAWVPPFDWLAEVHSQAREAGCAIYHKDNLDLGAGMRLKEFPWSTAETKALPDAFKYLDIQ